MKRKTFFTLSLSGVLLVSAQVFSQDQDTVDYRSAYNLILEQQWADARENFEQFSADWPESVWADDAAFWGCYSVEQEQSAEEQENFSCYQQFISSFPDSSWVADARTKMAVLGAELSALGYSEYIDQVTDEFDFDFDFDIDSDEISESVERAMEVAEREMERVRIEIGNIRIPNMPDFPDFPDMPEFSDEQMDDIRQAMRDARMQLHEMRHRRHSADDELLTIIGALRDDSRVSDLLIERLEDTEDDTMRTRLILLLEDLPGESISNTLLNIAENGDSEMVRNAAVMVLLDRDEENSRERLLAIATDDSYPASMRAEIIGELDDWEGTAAVDTLSRLLETESDPHIIREAADALSDMETTDSMLALMGTLDGLESAELRQEIIEEIADMDLPDVMSFLSETALSEQDDETAATAIEGIADREDGIAVAALENILYVFQYGMTNGIIRAFTAVPAHATFGILMGYFMGKAKFASTKQDRIRLNLTGLITATLFHGAYDFFLFINFIPGISIGAFLSLLLGIVFSRKAIKSHQESSKFKH